MVQFVFHYPFNDGAATDMLDPDRLPTSPEWAKRRASTAWP